MEKEENKNTQTQSTNDKKSKKIAIRTILVLVAMLIFTLWTAISFRAQYLKVIGIGKQYENVFLSEIENKVLIFTISAVVIYIFVYILNKFIKRGLKKFFNEEKKEMPKLPNKSLSLVLALIGGVVGSGMLADKFAIFRNAAVFGRTDPVFGADIGYYMFALPFIESLLIFLLELFIVAIIYVALYYVITLNNYFDGVDGETLRKNTFIKQELFILILATIVLSTYIFISAQNILTGGMVSIGDENQTRLVGAGKADVTIKLWGYRILSFVIILAIIRLLRYIGKSNFKQGMISVLIIPAYLFCMFAGITVFQIFYVETNELDSENEYIAYNIENTKTAYGIDIDQQNISSYSSITLEQVTNNENVIRNIPLISETVTQKAIAEHQENSVYYDYANTFLAIYKVNASDRLVYITPREILSDNTISYNNRTLKYTHGYSAIVSSANDSDGDGYAEYILSDFENEEILNIKEPRIYFGLETNSTIAVNTSFGKEYDYPITPTTNGEIVYDGDAGLKLNFIDRIILGISEKNYKLAFSDNLTEDSKIIANRNIIERAKTILPDILYDEEPYLVITDEGKLVWVLDAYTRSDAYPYSQSTTINIKGYKEKINYIRNSVKILIDAYDGTTEFYITDKSDPIIMTYRNMYPDLFVEEEIPQDIQKHLIYPKFLYKVQAEMINMYHDVSEDSLYRADDLWQITKSFSANSTIASSPMEPYYTMLKTVDNPNPELGLVLAYNKYEKQNIISYLVGSVRNGKLNLSLYKFNSESNVVGITQLNNQIEQDTTISKELEELNTTGTKLIKDMIIIPINNSLLYVEPVYQVMLNESEIPVLKKVIVASGNTVAIGNTLQSALTNLFSDDYSVDLEFINVEDMDALVDSVIKANNNLKQSLDANNFEMIGKDITRLQSIINQLETARTNELKNQNELENSISNTTGQNATNQNVIEENEAESLLDRLTKTLSQDELNTTNTTNTTSVDSTLNTINNIVNNY